MSLTPCPKWACRRYFFFVEIVQEPYAVFRQHALLQVELANPARPTNPLTPNIMEFFLPLLWLIFLCSRRLELETPLKLTEHIQIAPGSVFATKGCRDGALDPG